MVVVLATEEREEQEQALLLSTSSGASNLPNSHQLVDYRSIDYDDEVEDEKGDERTVKDKEMPLFTIVSILSTSFSYGCVMTTLFILTLPIECQRINRDHPDTPKSVALGLFVAIAGITQLVSPIVGRLSDTYRPPAVMALGQRMPYLVLGSVCAVSGMMGQMLASLYGFWIRYSFAFFLQMIGLNIMYAMMLAIIPDQVPRHQTGVANGILALLLVTGSLFGFGLFHSFLSQQIQSMYGLYICIVIVTTILTGTHAHDKDAYLTFQRISLRESVVAQHHVPLRSPEKSSKWRRMANRAAMKARQIALTPTMIVKSLLVEPFERMDWKTLASSYTIDRVKYHDFYIVTVSRFFYYCGMSVQTFFLYFVQDVIGVKKNAESVVATLSIVGQFSGALTCYPVGVISDRLLGGRRKPFVYLACFVLASATLGLLWARTYDDMVVFCLILGAANGIYLTMDTSLAVDTLPKEFEDDGVDSSSSSAQLLGVWGVAAFVGSALGPLIGGPLLYWIGHVEADPAVSDTREGYTIAGYAVVLSLSSFYFFCSAVSLRALQDHKE